MYRAYWSSKTTRANRKSVEILMVGFRYLRYVKPAYDNFVRPSSSHADIVSHLVTSYHLGRSLLHKLSLRQIVPGKDNSVAIELISTHIRRQLKERSNHFRKKMAAKLQPSLSRGPPKRMSDEELGLIILPQTPQLQVRTSWLRVVGSFSAVLLIDQYVYRSM